MTKNEDEKKVSHTFDLGSSYKEAVPLREETQPTSCTSSMEVTGFPLCNTVYANSSAPSRGIIIDPLRIKRSLESLEKNRTLQKKGLG